MFLNFVIGFINVLKIAPILLGFKKSPKSLRCLIGKTAIVTGGNTGIGFAIATKLASRGCKVIIANCSNGEKSRDQIKDTTGNMNIAYKHLDLSSLNSVRSFASDICKTEEKIDILVNNAGIGNTEKIVSEDGLNYLMQVNVFGAFLLTHLLLDPLKKSGSARVIFTSSGAAVLQSLTPSSLNPTDFKMSDSYRVSLYCNSKFCNNLVAQEFAKKLKTWGITVNSIDPIGARTKIFNNLVYFENFFWVALLKIGLLLIVRLHLEEVANSFLYVITECGTEVASGKHYVLSRIGSKPKIMKDTQFCRAIWSSMEGLVKLRPGEKISDRDVFS